MQNWLQAWQLAKLEIIASRRNIINLLLFLGIINYFLIELFKEYLEQPFFYA